MKEVNFLTLSREITGRMFLQDHEAKLLGFYKYSVRCIVVIALAICGLVRQTIHQDLNKLHHAERKALDDVGHLVECPLRKYSTSMIKSNSDVAKEGRILFIDAAPLSPTKAIFYS